MGTFKDLTNQKFNRLTAKRKVKATKNGWVWEFECECGKVVEKLGSVIASGGIKSCGCMLTEAREQGCNRRAHGQTNTRTYQCWQRMKKRCYYKNCQDYKNYGERGITVCEEWINSFENFLKDMGEIPNGYSIERKEVNGNYCKENCKYIPKAEQNLNKRNSVKITYNGETKNITEWARYYNMSQPALSYRLSIGMSFEEATTTPVIPRVIFYNYKGTSQKTSELEKIAGVPHKVITERIRRGWTVEKAVETPVNQD